jgi:hypothetical protein
MEEFAVAFSLLSGDEKIAQDIQRALPADVTAFLYTEEQERLLGAVDSVEALATAFRNAKICIILHRAGWGESRWTRLEAEIIKDRMLDEGAGFLLLVRLGDSAPPAWLPRNNFWVDYLTEGPERTAAYIAARLRSLAEPDAVLRATSRTFDRQPVPRSRYDLQTERYIEEYLPVRPVICDACTSAVVFRPSFRVTLPAKDPWPMVTERLCPRCARERGIQMRIPEGLDESTVFDRNPSFAKHVQRIVNYPVASALPREADLLARGVTHLGVGYVTKGVLVDFKDESGNKYDILIPFGQIERDDIRSDSELIEYVKARILESLDNAAN